MGRLLDLAKGNTDTLSSLIPRFRGKVSKSIETTSDEHDEAPAGVLECRTNLTKLRNKELDEESMRRLECQGVNIAIWDSGEMRVAESLQAIDDGGTIYSPRDMYHYVQLEPHERMLLHQFKKRFGGNTEWKGP